MTVNPKIFKAYDIRGIYPEELNEQTARLVGRAFVEFLRTSSQNPEKLNIVVGRDNRLSSPVLHRHLIRAITKAGANVIDIGLSTTPMFYFTVAHFGYDGGIQITASHNPWQYNGFKLVGVQARPISGKTGLSSIKKLVQAAAIQPEPQRKAGFVRRKKVIKDYLNFNLKEIDSRKLKPLLVAVDTTNAVSGLLVPELFRKIRPNAFYLFLELDGRFPNHPPDPLVKGSLRKLKKEIKKRKADLGVAFDADGDRIIFVTEKGEEISADLITALISQLILRESPGQKILYDVRSSNIVPQAIRAAGGRPVMGRVGHSFITERMRKENILFAGEHSGHYYHRKNHFCEFPLFVLLKILEELSQSGKRISQLIKPFQIYYHSGEINFKVKDKKKVLEKLERKFKAGKISKIDGLRIDFKDWWFNCRPSHTEPFLRLVLEAKTKKLMEERKKELTSLITGS
jgi:phosphomannomutase